MSLLSHQLELLAPARDADIGIEAINHGADAVYIGGPGFGGACPPQGNQPHRYIFTVYALKTDKIDVPADASAAMIGFMLNANKLATASFTAKFGR